jgi:hypothetical protein
MLDTSNHPVPLLEDFNVPTPDSNNGLSSPNCPIYTKLKADAIHSAACFLGLN